MTTQGKKETFSSTKTFPLLSCFHWSLGLELVYYLNHQSPKEILMFVSELIARGIQENLAEIPPLKKNPTKKNQTMGCHMPCFTSAIKCTPLPFTQESSTVLFSREQVNGWCSQCSCSQTSSEKSKIVYWEKS